MGKDFIIELLDTNGYVKVNKVLIKKFGAYGAIFIGELCSQYMFCKNNGWLVDGEWFYYTVEDMENKVGLGRKAQSSAIAQAESAGILSTKRIGLPAKRYYRIDTDALECAIRDAKECTLSAPLGVDPGCFSSIKNKNRRTRTEEQEQNICSAKKSEPFKPDLKFVTDVCVQNSFRGMNETSEQMAEWFCKVATEPDGTLNYRGRKIKDVASLVAVLRSADVSGKSFASARRGGHTNARGEDFDASGYWKKMGYGDD